MHAKGLCRKHYWAKFHTYAGVDEDFLSVTSQGVPDTIQLK